MMRTAQQASAWQPLPKVVKSWPCIKRNRSSATRFGQLLKTPFLFAPVMLPNLAGIGGCRPMKERAAEGPNRFADF